MAAASVLLKLLLNIEFRNGGCYTAGGRPLHFCLSTGKVGIIGIRRPLIRTINTCRSTCSNRNAGSLHNASRFGPLRNREFDTLGTLVVDPHLRVRIRRRYFNPLTHLGSGKRNAPSRSACPGFGGGHYRFDLFWCNNLKDEIANNKEVTRLSFDNDFFRNLVGGSKGCISVDGTSVPNRRSRNIIRLRCCKSREHSYTGQCRCTDETNCDSSFFHVIPSFHNQNNIEFLL